MRAPRFISYCGLDAVRYHGFPIDAEFRQLDLDAPQWPIAAGEADVVTAVETIEHLENPWAFMRALVEIAKPGGWVVVTTPNQLSALSLMTLVATTPNLVVNGELMRHGEAGFGFFVFTPIGVPVLLLAIAYMAVARRRLPSAGNAARGGRPSLNDWVDQYQLHDRAFRLAVQADSPLVGRSLEGLGLGAAADAHVIALERQHTLRREVLRVSADTEIRAGDILLLDVESKTFDVPALCERYALHRLPLSGAYFTDQSRDVGMAEAVIPVDSTLVGTTGSESRLLAQHGLTVVGLRRGLELAVTGHQALVLSHPLSVGGLADTDWSCHVLPLPPPAPALRRLLGRSAVVAKVLDAVRVDDLLAPALAPATRD